MLANLVRYSSMTETPLPYKRVVFPNGTRLLLIPMHGVSSMATSVMVGVGSRYETPQINGVSHFLEHMVFKGTAKYPTTDDVNVIERIGGLQNAYTDIDITNYHNKVLGSDWQLALEINKELAVHPRLEQQYVDKERDVILEEMKRYEDEPAAKVEEVMHELFYPGTPLGMPIIGKVDSLKAATAQTLTDYHRTWYTPEKMVIVMAGSMDDSQMGAIEKQAAEWFGTLSGKANGNFMQTKDDQKEPRLGVITKPDAQQAHISLGLRTFKRGAEERFAWSVFNLLMGVSFSSRLFREVREKLGLCYHIRSSSTSWADVGYWSIYAGVATEKVEETIKAVMHELALAVEKGVTEEEVHVSKKRLKTMLAFRSEDPEFQNEYYGRQELFGEPIMTLDAYLARIETVTTTEINALVKKYFVKQSLNLAVVWSKKDEGTLLPLLTL